MSIDGRTPNEEKVRLLDLWLAGEKRILISKPRVFGFGLNLQQCARIAFVGLGDSYEQYYQAIRRCWRYGQTRAVRAYVVLTEPEEPIYANVLRKEREAGQTAAALVQHVAAFERQELESARSHEPYLPQQPMGIPTWLRA